jgi:hypothetical protein
MEDKPEEVEKDYMEFRKEMEEEENKESKAQRKKPDTEKIHKSTSKE